MTRDGKVYLNAGIARAAGGTNSAMCHIIAEVLTLPYEDVMTGDWGNMDVCAEGGGQNGSSRTISFGAACQRAAEDMKAQLLVEGAAELGIALSDADLSNGTVYSKTTPTKVKKLSEIGAAIGTPIIGRGYVWAKTLQRDIPGFKAGTACEIKTMDACAAEIAVDTETGEVEVLSMTNADDCGKVIFLNGAQGQIEAGSEHIYAQAFLYEQLFDPITGATLNPGFLDNKVSTFLDWDDTRCKNMLIESNDACGPFGCKGMGEPVLNAYVAFANAFYNATGKWIKSAPLTPMKVLQALGKA
jgi:CO/xanthine dehydrogenase Mo-binding subunit